jgi:hypothetical protein
MGKSEHNSYAKSVALFSRLGNSFEFQKPNTGAHIVSMHSIVGKFKNSLPFINAIMIDVPLT